MNSSRSVRCPDPLRLLIIASDSLSAGVQDALFDLKKDRSITLDRGTPEQLPARLSKANRFDLLAVMAGKWQALSADQQQRLAARVYLLIMIEEDEAVTAVTPPDSAVLTLSANTFDSVFTQICILLVNGRSITKAAQQLNLSDALTLPDNNPAIWPVRPQPAKGATPRPAPYRTDLPPVEQEISWAAGDQVNIQRGSSGQGRGSDRVKQKVTIAGGDQVNIQSGNHPFVRPAGQQDSISKEAVDSGEPAVTCPHCHYRANPAGANYCQACGRMIEGC